MAVGPYMGRFLLDRLANEPRDLQIVALLMTAMKEEQGEAPVVPDPAPVTKVGSQMLKLIAANYSSHPDYKAEWAPQS